MPFKKSYLLSAFSIITTCVSAQKKAPENWFNLDPKDNKVYGVSTEKTYNELLKGKKPNPVIVAVIDGGTEVSHIDLKNVIWYNSKEIAGNKQDDDNNGYIDDINGWNFIGGKDTNVVQDNLEITRIYNSYNKKFAGLTEAEVLNSDKDEYKLYKKAELIYKKKYENAERLYMV